MGLFSVSILELDKCELRPVDKEPGTFLIASLIGDERHFKHYQEFFSTIGYMAHQVALIEDNIRQSMISLTEDYSAVIKETKNKNLGTLISLYELVYLSGLSSARKKEWFYAIKPFALKANKYRNEAVHSNWMFMNEDSQFPCYVKGDNYVVVPTLKMKQRAHFIHEVFCLFDDLRAAVEGPIFMGYDCNVVASAINKLDALTA